MKTEKEILLKETYDKFIQISLSDLSMEGMEEFIDQKVMGYGTTVDEKVLTIDDFRELVNRQREQGKDIKMTYETTPVILRMTSEGNSALFVDEIVISIHIENNPIDILLRISTVLEYREEKWVVIHWHASKPEYEEGETDTWHINEWKQKEKELEKLVAEKTADLEIKNKELEIEASLEKVRTVAMGMRKTDELINLAIILYKEIITLGFTDVRNTMINIFNDEKEIFLNYDYSYDSVSCVNEVGYNSHPLNKIFVEKMQKVDKAFMMTEFSGNDLDEWKKWRTSEGEIPDSKLDQAKSLYYYEYSIGKGAIGISTFKPITDEQLDILQKFRNVFDLSYQHFSDLKKAEAQAREAQIEAALERVRAVAMGMNKSEDLLYICEVSFKEFKKLGFDNLRNAVIHIPNDEQKYFMDYDYSTMAGSAVTKIEYGSHPIVDEYLKKIRTSKDAYYEVVIGEDQLQGWKDFRKNSGQNDDPRLDEATALYYYLFSIGIGDIGISTFKPINSSQIKVLKRFRNVFDLAYKRYNDITIAEMQAREARIETALERVRARTMAMHNSDELNQVVHSVYKELQDLEFDVNMCLILLYNEDDGGLEWWSSGFGKEILPQSYKIPQLERFVKNPMARRLVEARNKDVNYEVYELTGEVKREWDKILFEHTGLKDLPEEFKQSMKAVESVILSEAFMNCGILEISGVEPLSEDDASIIQRFAKVFEQTYTRFLDLQKAEALAGEAQIEAALERVRSKAMAMNSSEDLAHTVDTFFSELNTLNVTPHRCGMGIIDPETRIVNVLATSATQESEVKKIAGNLKLTGHPVLDRIFENWKLQKEYHPVLHGNEILDYYKVMNPQVTFPDFAGDETQYGYYFFFQEGGVFAWTDNEFAESELEIFRRYNSVLSLTYRRYIDLKEAEAQAREAQIGLALERIRVQAMAMNESSDLLEIVVTMRSEFVALGHEAHYFWHMRWQPEIYEKAMTSGDGTRVGMVMDLPRGFHENAAMTEWEKNDEPVAVFPYDVEGAIDYVDKMIKTGDFHKIDHNAPGSDDIRAIGGITFIMARTTHGEIGYSLPGVVTNPPAEDLSTLARFAGAFDLAYRRFEDLKEAEAQAREAQIEAALERVRSKAMAMHKSNDLTSSVATLFEELVKLGLKTIRLGIGIFHDGKTKRVDVWTISSADKSGTVQLSGNEMLDGHPLLDGIYDAWQNQHDYSYILEGKDLSDYYNVAADSNLPVQAPEVNSENGTQYYHLVNFPAGGLFAFQESEFTTDAKQLMRRFADVFHLTFIRHLDLKSAEAQAREAQIETALERVRSKTMAMHHSDELPEAANLLFQQVQALGMPAWSVGYAIWDEDKKGITNWMSSEGVIQPPFKAPLTEDPTFMHFREAFLRGETFYVDEVGGEELVEHYKYMRTLPVVGEILDKIIDAGFPLPTFQINHLAFFSQGFLLFITYEPVSDAWDIFKRFAKVFDQTYTRFLDLKNAEEQNKIIKVENERKTEELEEARELQLSMLPKELPQIPNLEIAVYMQTATEVGGDYYDFHVEEDGTLKAVIGDATGHGLKAGTIVTITKSLFHSLADGGDILSSFSEISRVIKGMNFRQLSMCLIMLKIKDDKLSISSAAMPPVLIYRKKDKSVEELAFQGMPLGAMKNFPYQLKETDLQSGDTIFLFSDGLPELMNGKNEMYGYDRTKSEFHSVGKKEPEEIVNHFKNSASDWADGNAPDDDVTFVVIKVK